MGTYFSEYISARLRSRNKNLELASTPERAEFRCGTDGVLYGWKWWDIKFKILDLSSKKQRVLGRVHRQVQEMGVISGMNGVPMAPHGLIFGQNEAYHLQEAF